MRWVEVLGMKMRLKKDSLGQYEMTFQAYYGIQVNYAFETYPIGEFRMHPQFICAMGVVLRVVMTAKIGLKLINETCAYWVQGAAAEVL